MIIGIVTTATLLTGSVSLANAVELKDLAPCKPAAARLCDRSQGMTIVALWKCGATLASHHEQVGEPCVQVLRRYGQL